MAMLRRDVDASKHHGKNPHHDVLLQCVKTERVFRANSDPSLPDDEPPF